MDGTIEVENTNNGAMFSIKLGAKLWKYYY
jgi:hypothetical protein